MPDIMTRRSRNRIIFQQRTNTDYRPAVLGSATGIVQDTAYPGYVQVREQTSNGLSSPRRVLWPAGLSVIPSAGTPVTLGWNEQQQEIVKGYDTHGLNAVGGNSITLSSNNLSGQAPQMGIATLAVRATQPTPDLNVSIFAWNPVINRIVYLFPGAVQDMTSYVPSAGNMLYALLAVKNDYATVEVKTSTARSLASLPLGLGDVQECVTAMSAGSTPVACVKLIGGQTQISQADLDNDSAPLQQMVNTSEFANTGTATLVAGTVVVSTTIVTASSRIFLTPQETGLFTGSLRVSARVAGTSFTILSSAGTDTCNVAWMVINP